MEKKKTVYQTFAYYLFYYKCLTGGGGILIQIKEISWNMKIQEGNAYTGCSDENER